MENETMEQLKERLNSSSKYLQSNDMRVIDVHEGYAKVEMVIDEQILNGHGFVHGGALFSLADTASRPEETASRCPLPSITSNRASAES